MFLLCTKKKHFFFTIVQPDQIDTAMFLSGTSLTSPVYTTAHAYTVKDTFSRHQKHTTMYNWSLCIFRIDWTPRRQRRFPIQPTPKPPTNPNIQSNQNIQHNQYKIRNRSNLPSRISGRRNNRKISTFPYSNQQNAGHKFRRRGLVIPEHGVQHQINNRFVEFSPDFVENVSNEDKLYISDYFELQTQHNKRFGLEDPPEDRRPDNKRQNQGKIL